MTLDQLFEARGIKLSDRNTGRYYTTCPRCSSQRSKAHQGNKVLGISIKDDGSANWGCNHCGWTGPEKGTGGNGRDPDVTYDYLDPSGALLFQKVRSCKNGKKTFWIRKPDGRGGFVLGAKGTDTELLYRRPEIDAAIAAGSMIAIAEGEKDCNNLWRLGIAATCNLGGAHQPGQKPKWYREHSEQLRGTHVVIFNDNDDQGRAHAEAVVQSLAGVAKRVQRLDLAQHWSSMPEKADISDWLAQGHERAELDQLIASAPDYAQEPQGAQQTATQPEQNGDAEDAELERLAKLSALEYDKQRKEAAEKLQCRAPTLDKLVAANRKELGLDEVEDTKQGRPMTFTDPEPWPDPVDGAELLNNISAEILRYMVMDKHNADICALWALLTYLVQAFWIVPRLFIKSPTRECGKSTLIGILKCLVRRPRKTDNITVSAVFRIVEKSHPTLLLDELDTYFKGESAEQMRGLLNSGHAQDGTFVRTVGEDFEPREFSTFAATAIAQIGPLHGTVASRSIRIDLRRKLRAEKVEDFSQFDVGHLEVLARKAARWAADHAEAARDAKPVLDGILNRARDNVRPLLAIADLAGAEWGKRTREAIIANMGAGDTEEGSRLEELLADIRTIFAESPHVNRWASADLVARLIDLEGRPWAELGKSRKPLTQNQLARFLKPLGITTVRGRPAPGEKPYWVYEPSFFNEAFSRFLSPQPEQQNNADGMGTSSDFATGTSDDLFRMQNDEKPNNDGACSGVPDAKKENRKQSIGPTLDDASRTLLAHRYNSLAYPGGMYGGRKAADAANADLRRELGIILHPEAVEAAAVEILNVAAGLDLIVDRRSEGVHDT
jgi:putative DNA primase/helicase